MMNKDLSSVNLFKSPIKGTAKKAFNLGFNSTSSIGFQFQESNKKQGCLVAGYLTNNIISPEKISEGKERNKAKSFHEPFKKRSTAQVSSNI